MRQCTHVRATFIPCKGIALRGLAWGSYLPADADICQQSQVQRAITSVYLTSLCIAAVGMLIYH